MVVLEVGQSDEQDTHGPGIRTPDVLVMDLTFWGQCRFKTERGIILQVLLTWVPCTCWEVCISVLWTFHFR